MKCLKTFERNKVERKWTETQWLVWNKIWSYTQVIGDQYKKEKKEGQKKKIFFNEISLPREKKKIKLHIQGVQVTPSRIQKEPCLGISQLYCSKLRQREIFKICQRKIKITSGEIWFYYRKSTDFSTHQKMLENNQTMSFKWRGGEKLTWNSAFSKNLLQKWWWD